jgi:hypothetical protein
MIHHGEQLVVIFIYFIIGLITSTLWLLFDSEIDAERNYIFLFLINLMYPVMIPYLLIKNIIIRILFYLK